MKVSLRNVFAFIATGALCATSVSSFSAENSAASTAAQANNPLANFTAFNIHYYNIDKLTETDESADQVWLRYAKPFSAGESNWLFRGSLPINRFALPPDGAKESGVGDLNMFAAYLIDVGNPEISFGVGPQLTMPTASEDLLGSEKWSAGVANVMFNATSKKFQYGYLLTWQHSFAGEDSRDTVNFAAFQPFAMYQLGKGYYMRSVGIWAYNLENDNYNIPIGLGIGKVFKRDKTVFNAFIEPQYTVAENGPGQPEQQILFGFNMQF